MFGNKKLATCNLGYEKHYYRCTSHTADGCACQARMHVHGQSDFALRVTYCGGHDHSPPGNRRDGAGQWGVTPTKIHKPCAASVTSSEPAHTAPKRRYTARRAPLSTPQTSSGTVHAMNLHDGEEAGPLGCKPASDSLRVRTPAQHIRARRSPDNKIRSRNTGMHRHVANTQENCRVTPIDFSAARLDVRSRDPMWVLTVVANELLSL
jgi:WRKY DNA -binding domain